jgi:hypothetical protein
MRFPALKLRHQWLFRWRIVLNGMAHAHALFRGKSHEQKVETRAGSDSGEESQLGFYCLIKAMGPEFRAIPKMPGH